MSGHRLELPEPPAVSQGSTNRQAGPPGHGERSRPQPVPSPLSGRFFPRLTPSHLSGLTTVPDRSQVPPGAASRFILHDTGGRNSRHPPSARRHVACGRPRNEAAATTDVSLAVATSMGGACVCTFLGLISRSFLKKVARGFSRLPLHPRSRLSLSPATVRGESSNPECRNIPVRHLSPSEARGGSPHFALWRGSPASLLQHL